MSVPTLRENSNHACSILDCNVNSARVHLKYVVFLLCSDIDEAEFLE
jgi:hypothetical protein